MRIHLLVNSHRPDAIVAARSTVAFLRSRNCQVGSDPEGAALLEIESITNDHLAECDLIVTFGGDGTLLRAAHIASIRGTPIMGVYYGRFGFVTQFDSNELGASLSEFFDGKSHVDERIMVQTELIRADRVVAVLHSLNEAVLQRAATTRMLEFDVVINGHHVTRYPADGVLVATPTGSTAYNLSAGGPIVDPSMQALILTAVTPHTLLSRPLILSADAEIVLKIETRGDAVLSCDGQSRLQMPSGDMVRVTRSDRVTRLVASCKDDFLQKVSSKFFATGP